MKTSYEKNDVGEDSGDLCPHKKKKKALVINKAAVPPNSRRCHSHRMKVNSAP